MKRFIEIILIVMLLSIFCGTAFAADPNPPFDLQKAAEIGERLNQDPVTEGEAKGFLYLAVYVFLTFVLYWGFRGIFKQKFWRSWVYAVCVALVVGTLIMQI